MNKPYRFHSKEDKLRLVKRRLSGESEKALSIETGISTSLLHKWLKQYLDGGEDALEPKKRPGNPLAKYELQKNLTREEELEYQVEVLKHEILKKDGEIVRLKKSIELEGGDTRRK